MIKIKKILHGLRKRGIINALKALCSRYWFELRYGLKMNPPTGQDREEAGNPLVKGHVRYEPICHFSFNRMLKNINWNFRDNTFIDFGCGKGAAILLASRYGFKKYIGVEYSQELVDECRANILKFTKLSKRDIDHEIICSDATRYLIPADVNVFYFLTLLTTHCWMLFYRTLNNL